MAELAWASAAEAKTDYNVTVSQAQLSTALEELLRAKGLALTTPAPPSQSFREAVCLQAWANKLATQAGVDDEFGNGIRLFPFDKKIMSKCIIPDPDPDDTTRDNGFVHSLIG